MPQDNPNSDQDIFLVDIYPTEILRTRASEITEFGEHYQYLGEKMLRTMYASEGIGLAANQIGLLERIIVMDCSEEQNQQYIMINPVITVATGETAIEEGCLSAPTIRGLVPRHEFVTVEYQDAYGEKHTLDAEGLLAICIQHEIDHLDGIMFFDHFKRIDKDRAITKLRKYVKQCRKQRR